MAMPSKYFIQEHLLRKVGDGGIGNVDAEKICWRLGYKPIYFPGAYNFSLLSKIKRVVYLLKMLLTLPHDAIILFQFPMYARFNRMLVHLVNKRKHSHVICFITDIDGLKNNHPDLLEKEIAALCTYQYFIVHNEAMQQWLLNLHPGATVAQIQFFDFLAKPVIKPLKKSSLIVFAGNLVKSSFLEHLGELKSTTLHFNLYGPGINEVMQLQDNSTYKGAFEPYSLIDKLEGAFGLVWDGSSIHEAAGNYGTYMHLISHHKASLYIVAGIPLIVFEGAGTAPLITRYQIGLLVKSLDEIEEKISNLSEEDYQHMCRNTRKWAKRIVEGKGLEDAIHEIERQI